MQMNFGKFGVVLFLLVATETAFGTDDKTLPTLCDSKPTIVFNCATKSGKWISVCTSLTDKKKIEYRFGKPGHTELILPKTKDDRVSYNSVAYSGGGGAYIRFSTLNTDYIVYSRIIKGSGDDSGVLVKSGSVRQRWIKCSKNSDLDLPALEKLKLKREASDQDPLIEGAE
jgi:hypothetical protein